MSCLGGIEQTRFLGASVMSFNASVGWNEQTSSVSVSLAEDVKNGDEFTRPETGTPVKFTFGDFEFCGIIQSWEYKKSISGFIYEVLINDPRELLDGVHLILDGYSGSTTPIKNLWNAFGYWENADTGAGFGGSRTNEAGMPWNKILEAIQYIQLGNTGFGNKLSFKGYEYVVDFSNLPIVPDYYRIPGGASTLLQAISQVCIDAGYDYIVSLSIDTENTISFKKVSRKNQPSLDGIQRFIDSRTDATVRDNGLELRNEVTSRFIVGGNRERIYRSNFSGTGSNATIWPYWGLDNSGNVIVGTGTGDNHTFTVPCDIAGLEVLGGYYTMKVIELRAALAGVDEWLAYMETFRSELSSELGILSPLNFADDILTLLGGEGASFLDLQNTKKARLEFISDDVKTYKIDKLYSFVKFYAEEFYGKKFMVTVPFVVAQLESETGRVVTSSEPSDGGFLEKGESSINLPLGLPNIYEDIFSNEDGRYTPFIKFQNAQNYDLDNLSPDVAYLYNQQIFVRCDIEPYFVYLNSTTYSSPRVVINLPGPVNSKTSTDQAPPHLELILKLMQEKGATKEDFDKLRERMSHFPIAAGYAQAANIPTSAAVTLRSNVLTYGPWYIAGPDGKVEFEKDESLVPWNFGGYSVLDLAGNAKVENALTAQQQGELGTVEVAGSPDKQLGDEIVDNGPNITDISMSIGIDGVKTTYRLRTYSPSFGRFSKQNADRFQRIGRQTLQLRRNLLSRFRKSGGSRSIESLNRRFITKDGPEFIGKSPHEVIVSSYIDGGDNKVRCITSTTKLAEGVSSLIGKTGSDYSKTSMMSFEGLFRGYSVETDKGGMPHFEPRLKDSDDADTEFALSNFDYFPFTQNTESIFDLSGKTDVKILTYGEQPPTDGINTVLNSHQLDKARGIGFAGPMYMVGWGYDLFDKPVPNSANAGLGVEPPSVGDDAFLSNFRQRCDMWKAGPIDFKWDNFRKLWTFPYLIPGIYNGNNTIDIYEDIEAVSSSKVTMDLHAWFDFSTVESGTKVLAYPVYGKLTIVAADCSGS